MTREHLLATLCLLLIWDEFADRYEDAQVTGYEYVQTSAMLDDVEAELEAVGVDDPCAMLEIVREWGAA